jgi:hypothetical protein
MIIPPTIRNTSNEMPKMLKTLSPISAEAARITRMVSATLGCPPSLRQRQLWRQRQKDRAAHHRVDDGQNGHDGLHHMVKVHVEIRLKIKRHACP